MINNYSLAFHNAYILKCTSSTLCLGEFLSLHIELKKIRIHLFSFIPNTLYFNLFIYIISIWIWYVIINFDHNKFGMTMRWRWGEGKAGFVLCIVGRVWFYVGVIQGSADWNFLKEFSGDAVRCGFPLFTWNLWYFHS